MILPAPIETSRLVMRKETESDANDIYEILTDHDVMKYVGDGSIYTGSLEEVRRN